MWCLCSVRYHVLQEYNTEGAFSAAVLLSGLAMGTIVIKNFLEGQVAKDVE